MKNLAETVLKYTLQNSIKYGGRASVGAVIGKIISEDPKQKKNIGELKKEIERTIKEISKKSVKQQTEELKKIAPELLEEKKVEEKKELPPLKNAKKGEVVLRFEPSPSGPLHVGHAYVLGLNYLYSRLYEGKLILRISDTNPENIYPQAYKLIPEDANWLTKDGISEVQVQSDRMNTYYSHAEKLIDKENAYVCTCSQEVFKEYADNKKPCPCRNISKKENIERWRKMFKDFKEGEAVLRIKTDYKHKNPALRDWVAFRIVETAYERQHIRQGDKYRVWPMMNFAVSIDDIEMKVTHAIRGKDHYDNAKKQEYVYKYLGKKAPEMIFLGRINFIGMEVSCSKTRPFIDSGEYSGWDDIRLPFLAALKRRGFEPDALLKFASECGVSMNDKTIPAEEYFKLIGAYNKDVIDAKANRYFFVDETIEIDVKDAPARVVNIDLHPNHPDRGKRTFKTRGKFYITKLDFDSTKPGKLYRLMDCANFVRKGKSFAFDSADYGKFKEKGEKIFHWLPVDETIVNVKVLMPDGTVRKGFGEEGIKKLKVGDTCQFERFGFVRLDSVKGNKYEFWFAHK